MSSIRALERDDTAAVADLLVSAFQNGSRPSDLSLARYIEELFLDFPDRDPEINSLVHVDASNKITGFIGVLSQKFAFEGRTLRMAACNSFSVDKNAKDPMAAGHLLRAFIQGPQDFSLSDRCNRTSVAMWRLMRGPSLPYYSLDWERILHPAGYLAARAVERTRRAALLLPLAPLVDSLLTRMGSSQHWALVPARGAGNLVVEDTDDDTLVDIIPQLVADIALRPVWTEAGLRRVLRDGAHKSQVGTLVRQVVRNKSGGLLGAYLYYTSPRGIAETLHVLPAKGQAGLVLDCLLQDAKSRGAVAVRGRAQPVLLEPLMDRLATFSSPLRCLASARDPQVMSALQRGDAVVTGLVGEYWTRLNGDAIASGLATA